MTAAVPPVPIPPPPGTYYVYGYGRCTLDAHGVLSCPTLGNIGEIVPDTNMVDTQKGRLPLEPANVKKVVKIPFVPEGVNQLWMNMERQGVLMLILGFIMVGCCIAFFATRHYLGVICRFTIALGRDIGLAICRPFRRVSAVRAQTAQIKRQASQAAIHAERIAARTGAMMDPSGSRPAVRPLQGPPPGPPLENKAGARWRRPD